MSAGALELADYMLAFRVITGQALPTALGVDRSIDRMVRILGAERARRLLDRCQQARIQCGSTSVEFRAKLVRADFRIPPNAAAYLLQVKP